MKQKIFIACLATIAILNIQISYATEPKNLALVEKGLIQYHDSHQYEKDTAAVINQAMQYLKAIVAKNDPAQAKMALVLDIDETSLSNYQDMVTLNFGGTLADIIQAEDKGTDPVIAPTLALYNYAKAHHIAVFFITGRTEKSRIPTEKNLTQAGYKEWDGLTLKPDDYSNASAAPFKIAARKAIAEQGYKIVLNIGDQESDLKGGYADKTYKLPNPYYFIP
jgi:predicted secreted acid phosphatase